MFQKAIRIFSVSALALSLGACMTLSGAPTAQTTAVDPALTSPDLNTRAQAQANAYKANPQDAANALAYSETLASLSQHEQQNAVLERVVMSGVGDADVMAAYGKSLISIGEYARADQVLSQAFQADMPDWRVLSARGVANDKLGNHREARALYEHALRVKPDEPSVLANLGLSHAFERDYGQAEVYLRRSIAQPGADPRAQQNLALIQGLQGKKDQEKSTLSKVASGDDTNDALAATAKLKRAQEGTPRNAPAASLRTRPKLASQ